MTQWALCQVSFNYNDEYYESEEGFSSINGLFTNEREAEAAARDLNISTLRGLRLADYGNSLDYVTNDEDAVEQKLIEFWGITFDEEIPETADNEQLGTLFALLNLRFYDVIKVNTLDKK